MGIFRKNTDFTYSQPPSPWRKRILIISGIFILVLIAVSLGLKVQKKNSYQSTSTKFLSYVQEGDAVSSYALFDSEAKLTVTQSVWAAQVAKLQKVFKGQSPQFISQTPVKSSGKKDGALLNTYKIKGDDGTYTVNILITNASPPMVLNFSSRRTSVN